jgi:carotenoid 1,2-hydratase
MTERGRSALHRTATDFVVGPSSLNWDGATLTLSLDEIGFPLPQRIKGTIRLSPSVLNDQAFSIDSAGRHRWMPIAPMARVSVDLQSPNLSWNGHGYFDTNAGDEPMEDAFSHWDWSRADLRDGAAVLYDTHERDGTRRQIAAHFNGAGEIRAFEPPDRVDLPGTFWGIKRGVQADQNTPARVVQTLEDTPFYARSVLSTRLLGQDALSVHESLSLGRFRAPIVKLMLPFRMPRRFW